MPYHAMHVPYIPIVEIVDTEMEKKKLSVISTVIHRYITFVHRQHVCATKCDAPKIACSPLPPKYIDIMYAPANQLETNVVAVDEVTSKHKGVC